MVKPSKKINIKENVSDNVIDFSMSNLTDVPAKELAAFKRCTTLDLSRNKIVELPKTFGLLTHLTRLDLSSNQIKMLPAEIGLLVNLRHFDLYNNEMVYLPWEMSKLKQLRYLDVKGNPLSDAIKNFVGPCLTNVECARAAKKMIEFLTTVKQQVDNDRELLRQSRLQAVAHEKESIANGEPPKSDAELVPAEPQVEKAEKKPKPPSKKMKKLLEQKNLENQVKSVANGDTKERHKSTNFLARFVLILIFLAISLPILTFFVLQRYDGRQINHLIKSYIHPSYQVHVHIWMDHLRLHVNNYANWFKQFLKPNDATSK